MGSRCPRCARLPGEGAAGQREREGWHRPSARVRVSSDPPFLRRPTVSHFRGLASGLATSPLNNQLSSEGSRPGAQGRKKRTEREGTEKGRTCFLVCTKGLTETQGK